MARPKKAAPAPAPDPDELLTTQEVADYFKVSPRTVHDWVLDEKLSPDAKAGRLLRFKRSTVVDFGERCKEAAV